MESPISIAIETSCRRGGIALGSGEALIEAVAFGAERRQSVQLVARLDEMLARHGLRARDAEEVYVSVGPGSFTGLRVGITVARTLAQVVEEVRCVAVPTVEAVAENAAGADFQHLGVVMDAKEANVYAAIFTRRGGRIVQAGQPKVVEAARFAAEAPKPITLIGEGLGYHSLSGEGITLAEEGLWLPTAEGVWRVGRRLALAGKFTRYQELRPLYLRKPEAVRLWEKRRRSP